MHDKNIEHMISSLDPKYHKHLIEVLKGNSDNPKSAIENFGTNDGISADLISEMLKKTMDALNEKYIEGGVAYIDKHHPEISRKLDDAEGKLNAKANAYYDGKIDLEEFKSALKQWYLLHLKAIEIHKNYLKEINY